MSVRACARGFVAILASSLLLAAATAAQTTWHVDDDAPNDPGPGDPQVSDPLEDGSPEHPFDAIREGIDAAEPNDAVMVLDGTYTGPGNRNLDLQGKPITVRSENGPENCIIDCEGSDRGFFFHSNETASSRVEGFTIRNGSATYGGGVYCSSSPTLQDCIIESNVAYQMGQWDGVGGGVYCIGGSPTIRSCTLANNTAHYLGGGIDCEYADPTISNCTIIENDSSLGGGIFVWDGLATIQNCMITGNAAVMGGGIGCVADDSLIRNCTISGNGAGSGGGLFYDEAGITIQSCVFWGNAAEQGPEIAGFGNQAIPTVSYSDVAGGLPPFVVDGGGNINAVPEFVVPYHLSVHSPCIDQGDPDFVPPDDETDIDGEPRMLNGRVDMGADEYQEGDCNHNDVPDEEDIAGGTSEDCNESGFPDECEPGGDRDCDGDGVSDLCAIYTGISDDCNGNGIPDGCDEPDCNDNDVPDECDLASGTSEDCNENGVPDECEPGGASDCNGNGLPDLCDIYSGNSEDCNENAVPDECEFGWDQDCDSDGVSDLCEIYVGTAEDFDQDGIPDECEAPRVIFVDDDAPNDPGPGDPEVSDPEEDGSLAHPYDAIQNAIDVSISRDAIIVLDGTYSGIGNKNLSFGGRRIFLGSANGPTSCTIDAQGDGRIFRFNHNETVDACLDGFTITNAFARYGGGIYCNQSSPTIRNCTIANNAVSAPDGIGKGGGIYCYQCSPLISDCIIAGNTANFGPAGVYCYQSSPIIQNCEIVDNQTTGYGGTGTGGGILCNGGGSPLISNCVVSGNTVTASDGNGGGLYCVNGSTATICNCLIVGNTARRKGGGVICFGSNITIRSCTISRNTVTDSAGMGGGLFCRLSSPAIRNCVLWENSAVSGPEIYLDDGQSHPTVAYTDVAGGLPAGVIDSGGNIDDDPLFLNPAEGDFHLPDGSPCVETGDPAFAQGPNDRDIDGQWRVWDGDNDGDWRIDMGSDEFGSHCPGDLDGDGEIGPSDLVGLLANYGLTGMSPANGDFDLDGDVDLSDLAALLAVYGTTCE